VSIAQRTRVGRLKIRADRVIYTTITLLCVLIIYDGWEQLQFLNVATVIAGPILAIFSRPRLPCGAWNARRSRSPADSARTPGGLLEECRFLLVAVPPLAILVVLTMAGVSYSRTIQVIVLCGVVSLGVWGGVAGRRAGLTGWALTLSIAYGLMLGGIVLALQALLPPGQNPFRP
jgi:hypothetical protein